MLGVPVSLSPLCSPVKIRSNNNGITIIIYMYSGTSDKGHSVLKETNTKKNTL